MSSRAIGILAWVVVAACANKDEAPAGTPAPPPPTDEPKAEEPSTEESRPEEEKPSASNTSPQRFEGSKVANEPAKSVVPPAPGRGGELGSSKEAYYGKVDRLAAEADQAKAQPPDTFTGGLDIVDGRIGADTTADDKGQLGDEDRPVGATSPELEAGLLFRGSDGHGPGAGLVDRTGRGALVPIIDNDTEATYSAPDRLLPRTFYFENTYLGGSAAYAERLRRLAQDLAGESRPYEIVQAEVQPFDAPRTEGLAVTASVDATHIDRPRRVFLQVGLRGSARYGWRRPPLDVVLVVDHPALQRGGDLVTKFVVETLRQLGPADRIGIVLAGAEAEPFLELSRTSSAQQHLARRIDELRDPTTGGSRDLAEAMARAGRMLEAASDEEATVPGSRTILVLSGDEPPAAITEATEAAHALTIAGCVTSVFALDVGESDWWRVANAGYGNLHRVAVDDFARAIEDEMRSLARVVARLVRVNVRLGKEAGVIRVLGTRVLEAREVEEVKARELATDRNLSKSLGITSDRGEDDDGIQTVIPYFYGDDSHVVLIELWVTGPGPVADVTVRYKDMVNLENATARASVRLGARPQPATPEQLVIARNVHGFELAENLQRASDAIMRNDLGDAVRTLGAATTLAEETNALDREAIQGLKKMVEQGDWQANAVRRATVQETLLISGQRRVGDTNQKK